MAKELWFPAVLVALYDVWARNEADPLFPTVGEIIRSFNELWLFEGLGSAVWPTLRNIVIGFAIAVFVGVVLGTALGLIPRMGNAFMPILYFLNSIPPIALVPIFLAIFGFQAAGKVAVVAVAASIPVILAARDGIRSTEPVLIDVAEVYRFRLRDRILRMRLPSAAPQLFPAFRLALQLSFMVAVASEMLGSVEGVGFIAIQAQQTFAIADVWASILLLGILGYIAYACFTLIEKRALRWYQVGRRPT